MRHARDFARASPRRSADRLASGFSGSEASDDVGERAGEAGDGFGLEDGGGL